MNRVLEVNEEELWARVQPGLVQDELNHHVRPLGLLFGPDTSTSNRATIGGMLGNNSGRLALDRLRPHRRARDRDDHDPRRRQPRGLRRGDARAVQGQDARCPGWKGRSTARSTRIRDAVRRPRSGAVSAALAPRLRLQPGRAGARTGRSTWRALIVGSEGTLLTVVEAKMRLVQQAQGDRGRRDPLPRHAGGARVLAGHPRDRALRRRAHRQDDPRPRPREHRAGAAHGIRAGRSRGDPDRGVRGGHRRRRSRPRSRPSRRGGRADASATPRTSPTTRASSSRSGSSARPASACCSGVQRRGQADRVHRGHRGRPEAPARVRAALPRDHGQARGATAPTTATARWGACTSAR